MFSFIYNWLLICQFLVVVEGQGGKPSDNVIRMFYYVVGKDALLPCDNVDADWQYVNLSTSIKPRDIASSGQVVWTLLAKYSMEKASDGSADVGLIVHNASYDDAGIYCCSKDLQGFRYMHLVIEEVSPKIEETAQIATVPSTSDVVTADLQSCENDDSRLILSFVFNVIFIPLFVVFAVLYLRPRCERRTMRHCTHREETVDQDEQVELNPADQHHSALPVTPTHLDASEVTTSSVKLTWNSGNDNSVISFIIQYKQKNTEGSAYVEIHDVTGTEYSVVGLNANTVYEFRVFAVNDVGRSPPSSPLDVTTREQVALPLTPTRLDVSEVTTSSVKLTWNPGNNNSIIIQYKQKNTEETTYLEIHDVTGTEYTVVGLNANTVYEFRAFAVNDVGRSPPSSPLDVTTREQVDCSDVEQSDTTLPIADQQKPVWKENITEERNVRNFAKLRDRTYVAFRLEIREYLDHFDKPNRTIPIPEEVCCKYFSAHITSNCLYIADDQNRCVWRTKLDLEADDKDRTIKWYTTTNDNNNIECVSVRSDKEIVVLLRDEFWGGHYWRGRLVICNMNGEETKTINLLPDLINPYAVTCTSPQEGTFLVAFEGGLKEINKEGRSVGSCSREFKLTHPRKCYYDRASKCTFVIDVGNMRLLQLDRTLSSSKTVMQWTSNGDSGLDSHPVRVHYDSELKLLTVGMLSGRISVFTYSV